MDSNPLPHGVCATAIAALCAIGWGVLWAAWNALAALWEVACRSF